MKKITEKEDRLFTYLYSVMDDKMRLLDEISVRDADRFVYWLCDKVCNKEISEDRFNKIVLSIENEYYKDAKFRENKEDKDGER